MNDQGATRPATGLANEAQHFREGGKASLIVSVVRDGTVGISTAVDQYVQLNERELVWFVEQAGPRALAVMRTKAGES
jgi:hypothetical protein